MSTAFHCSNCGSVTDVASMLRAFEENPHCPTCGLSASESDAKIHDDLANMMARNLHLGAMQAPTHDVSMPPTPQVAPQPGPITYVSQHYHHSSHIVSNSNSNDLPASTLLRDAGVDPNVLLPCQLQLFKNADMEQRQRLIELWKIAPPTFGAQLSAEQMTNWPQTSMDLEEQAARERWHKQEQEKWKNLTLLPELHQAEPYMTDVFETKIDSQYHQATDPAYTAREWWNLANEHTMEHQYGMLQMQREMNEFYQSAHNSDHMMS